MEQTVKASTVVSQCRNALASLTVQGPVNCKILAAVYDDLGHVERYLLECEAKSTEVTGSDPNPNPDGNV